MIALSLGSIIVFALCVKCLIDIEGIKSENEGMNSKIKELECLKVKIYGAMKGSQVAIKEIKDEKS